MEEKVLTFMGLQSLKEAKNKVVVFFLYIYALLATFSSARSGWTCHFSVEGNVHSYLMFIISFIAKLIITTSIFRKTVLTDSN